MKKTTTILITLIIGFTTILFSKDINLQTAEKVASNFFFERVNSFEYPINFDDLNIVNSKLIDDAYYVFNFTEGWILVSANDAMIPILGYNYHGSFPETHQQSDNFKSWMQHYVDQVIFTKENNIETENYTTKWNKYLTDDLETLVSMETLDEVEPLLTSTWHQNFPYNLYCPEDPEGPGGHAFVGCVATGMAQIMEYWRNPYQGVGSRTYYCYPYGDLSVNFGETSYEWDAMHDVIDFNNPWNIAQISYHAAVSLDMNFGPNGSGTTINKVPNALCTYFMYDTSAVCYFRVNFSLDNWKEMIWEDLDNHQPLDYGGQSSNGGHNFVCDGYQGADYFHFNFGWNGNANGYYTLDNLNGFNTNQKLVKNIYPADPDYPYIADGPDTLSFLSGSFTDGSGPAQDYPFGMEASWLIDPQSDTDSVSNITLTFIQFITATSDYLRVYDGETTNDMLLGEFSGDDLPDNISSTGNKMLVTFSSEVTGEGFKIEYHPSYPEYCQNLQVFSEPSGTISDGSGTFFYNNLTSCIYTIECPAAIKYTLEFTSFETEENNDILSLYDGNENLIGEFSGSELPGFMEIVTDKIILIWSSNEIVREDGWSFDYFVDFTGISERKSKNDLFIIPNPFTHEVAFEFELSKSEFVSISIYNHLGEQLEVITEYKSVGQQKIEWNCEDMPTGIYFCVLKTNNGRKTKKMIKL